MKAKLSTHKLKKRKQRERDNIQKKLRKMEIINEENRKIRAQKEADARAERAAFEAMLAYEKQCAINDENKKQIEKNNEILKALQAEHDKELATKKEVATMTLEEKAKLLHGDLIQKVAEEKK